MGNQNSTPRQPRSTPSPEIQDILADADPPFDKSSSDELYDQLSSSGIFLANKTQKFWVNKRLNCNCFMLYARALDIAWGNDQRYWKWKSSEESSGTVEVAKLRNVFWLDVIGKLDNGKLSPGVMYGVSFHVMLKDSARYPAKVSLKFRGAKYQENEINFAEMIVGTWMEIPVAQFVAPAQDEGGEMEFSLWNKGGDSKRGLLVKGASIKPL